MRKTKAAALAALTVVLLMWGSQALAITMPHSPDEYFPKDPGDKSHSFGLMLGASEFGDDVYLDYEAGLELNFGLVGLGVSIPLHTLIWDNDPENTNPWYNKYLFRESDWDEVSDYFRILRYVRYGYKYAEENWVYAMFGELRGVNIGHGTILGMYYNNLDPNHWTPGLQADVYTPWGGVETFFNNVTKPYVVGGRVYIKPYSFVDTESYWSNIAIGMTVMADARAPKTFVMENKLDNSGTPIVDANGNTVQIVRSTDDNYPDIATDDALVALGWDVEFKVLNKEWIRLTPFIDVNHIVDNGTGMHLGVLADFMFGVTINTRLEYRYFGEDYLPTYFDSFYEIERYMFAGTTIPKQIALKSVDGRHGYYAGASVFFLDLVRLGATFEDYQGADNSSLVMFLDIPALDIIEFSAMYFKLNFDDADEIFTFDEKSLFIAQAKFHYSMLVLYLQFTRSWAFDDESGSYEPFDNFGGGVGFEMNF